jgi:hypothetical protein
MLPKVDAAIDAECEKFCKEQACAKKEEECVRDKVVNLSSSNTCIAGAKTCKKTPNKPDYCAELHRFGECTCKCIPKAQPKPTAVPG